MADAQLSAVLQALTAPDTTRIKQAEEALKPLLKTSQCVPALLAQLSAVHCRRGIETSAEAARAFPRRAARP